MRNLLKSKDVKIYQTYSNLNVNNVRIFQTHLNMYDVKIIFFSNIYKIHCSMAFVKYHNNKKRYSWRQGKSISDFVTSAFKNVFFFFFFKQILFIYTIYMILENLNCQKKFFTCPIYLCVKEGWSGLNRFAMSSYSEKLV